MALLAAGVALMVTLGGCAPAPGGEGRTEKEPGAVGKPWSNNILMSNPADVRQANGEDASSVFGTDMTREEVGSVTVLDTVENVPEEAVDVSQSRDGSVLLWAEGDGELFDLYLAGEGGVAAPEDCTELFAYYTNAVSFSFHGAFHTENAVSMKAMFKNNFRMTQVDLETFDTGSVTDMSSLFSGCTAATGLNIGGWDTARVASMYSMFYNCNQLVELDLNRWDTSSLTNIGGMFQSSENLREIAVSDWDVSQVTDMYNLFKGVGATRLDLSGWDMGSVTDASEMFRYSLNLTELVVGEWDLSGADTEGMFLNCGVSGPTRMGGSSGGGEMVAAPLGGESYVPQGAVFPDLAAYAGSRIRFETAEKSGDGFYVQSLQCELDDYSVLEDYVDMLVEHYDFRLAETPYYQHYDNLSGEKTYFDFLLEYTGPEKLSGGGLEGFSGAASGDVRIYGAAGYRSVSGSITYNSGLTPFDDGRRWGGDSVDAAPVGASAAAGLIRLSDGRYQTSDGRLTAGVGEAAFRCGSGSETYSARFHVYSAGSKAVFVEDSHGAVLLRLSFPAQRQLSAGQTMSGLELADDHAFLNSQGAHKNNAPLDSLTTFYAVHDGTYYSPVPGLSGEITGMNVRVMYWQEDETAVFHVGLRYRSQPTEEEYLIVMSLRPEDREPAQESSGGSSGGHVPSSDTSGRPVRIRCTFIGCSDGWVECSACDGEGGRRVYDHSTPQYDGVNTNANKWDWERCSKCGGTGQTRCSRCGGSGWLDVN